MEVTDALPCVTQTLGGQEEKFQKLSLDDIFLNLLPAEKKRRKALLVENLKIVGGEPSETLGELQAFDEWDATFYRPPEPEGGWNGEPPLNFVDFVSSQRGKIYVVKHAWDQANPGVTKTISPSLVELNEIVEKLMKPLGLTFVSPEPPPTTAAYGDEQSASGSENPPQTSPAYGQ